MILTKEMAHQARADFFQETMAALRTPPQPIDEALDQRQYYFPPAEALCIQDTSLGDFLVVIDPVFFGQKWPLSYSMWQIGEQLKIAVILEGPGEHAPAWDPLEFNDLWGDQAGPPVALNRGSKIFYEWTFQLPGFHSNYAMRERFSLGMRHMHFRALKVLQAMAEKSRLRKDERPEA